MRKPLKPLKVQRGVRVPRAACLSCGYELTGATCVEETDSERARKVMPKAGDITLCIMCGHLMSFDESLKLVELTKAQMIAVAGDRRVLVIQQARGMTQKESDNEGTARVPTGRPPRH